MTRPTYGEHPIERVAPNGDIERGVEIWFGRMNETDAEGHGVWWRSTLWEDWVDRTAEERQAEAETRYDQWVEAVNVATDPAVPTLQSLRDDVAAQEDALRTQQRNLLDARGRLAEGEANQQVAVAVQDGPWSSGATWDTGVVPDVDTKVVIPPDVTVAVDIGVTVTATTEAPPEEPTPEEG